jgi:hypothetical protein
MNKLFSSDAFIICIGIFILVSSYVMGHLFYRRDPKKPDYASFHRFYKSELKQHGDFKNWVIEVTDSHTGNVKANIPNTSAAEHRAVPLLQEPFPPYEGSCQYPYNNRPVAK